MKCAINLLLGLTLLITSLLKAQDGENKSTNFAKKGDHFINLNYGFSITNAIIRGVASISAFDVKFRALGPIGLNYEYIVEDGIGLGLDMSYASFDLSFKDIYEDPTNGIQQEYGLNFKYVTYRFFGRVSFHLTDDTKNDFYPFVSAGYKRNEIIFTTSIPEAGVGFKFPKFSSFGFKPGIGYRYFFNDGFGINAELALGSPFASAGLSFKFR